MGVVKRLAPVVPHAMRAPSCDHMITYVHCLVWPPMCPHVTSCDLISSPQADKIKTLVKAAGVDVEPIWPSLFAKALEGQWSAFVITRYFSGTH